MSARIDRQDNIDLFREKYGRARSEVARRVHLEVLGHDNGLTGYTSTEQAATIGERLHVSPGDFVLDVGAGRGWPGTHVAIATRCRLMCTDIPLEGLADARSAIQSTGLVGSSHVAAADARAIPFRDGIFDGVIHADVFC